MPAANLAPTPAEAEWSSLHTALNKANTAKTDAERALIKKFNQQLVGGSRDIRRELGLEAQAVKRHRQFQAYEDPVNYKGEHDQRIKDMADEVERVYYMNFEQQMAAGHTEEQSSAAAKKVASAMMEAQESAINSEFNMNQSVVKSGVQQAKVVAEKVRLKMQNP